MCWVDGIVYFVSLFTGGAIYTHPYHTTRVQIANCTFDSQHAPHLGGALYLTTLDGTRNYVKNCTFTKNGAARGLDIFLYNCTRGNKDNVKFHWGNKGLEGNASTN